MTTHKKKCVCGHLLDVEEVYKQGRADEQLQSIEDAKMQATEYLNALDKAKEEAYQQGKADAVEEFRNKLFEKIARLTLSMWNFKLFDDALQETYNELKEKNNDNR